jgi:malonyl CoA-acyl carrier protein transacylase/aryl carrier-like protein
VFRDSMQACDALLRPRTGFSLFDALEAESWQSRLTDTQIAQPVLFAIQVGLAALLRSYGIVPDAVLGHSLGELAAAHGSGALSLAQAAELVCRRAALMQQATGGGKMALVALSAADAQQAIAPYPGELSIAAHNAPTATVIAGETDALHKVLASLATQQVYTRLLPANYAFHSPQMESLAEQLRREVRELTPCETTIPFFSSLTGERAAGSELGADYWARQLREPVRFGDALDALVRAGHGTFVELGPQPVLCADIEQALTRAQHSGLVVPTLRAGEDDQRALMACVARLYEEGRSIRWEAMYTHAEQRVSLPAYPWQRERCWLSPTRSRALPTSSAVEAEPESLYALAWQRCTLEPARCAASWLIFADRTGVAAQLAQQLRERGERVHVLTPATASAWRDERGTEAPLSKHLAGVSNERALRVVWLPSLDAVVADATPALVLGDLLLDEAGALASLVGALANRTEARLWLVTQGAQSVHEEGPEDANVAVVQSALWGLGRTVAAEHPGLWGGLLDLDPRATAAQSAAALLGVLSAQHTEDAIALRAGELYALRLVRAAERESLARSAPTFHAEGTYLITGGLGGLGLAVASWMVTCGARRLILVGRTPLPPRACWSDEQTPRVRQRIDAVRALEAQGVSVRVASLDIADEAALRGFLSQVAEQMPAIRGVVHAAGLLGDVQSVLALDRLAMAQVIAPKVLGGWNLFDSLGPRSLFVDMGEPDAQRYEGNVHGLQTQLVAMAPAARRVEIERLLRLEVGRALGLAPAQLPAAESLLGLGFDSIMALELRNRLQRQLGLSLPMAELLSGPSVTQLCELVSSRIDGAHEQGPRASAIAARHDGAPAPLSSAQERFWVLHELDPKSAASNLAGVLHLRGAVDRSLLERAFTELVTRHEILRTHFGRVDGETVQLVGPALPITLAFFDLTTLAEGERAVQLVRLTVDDPRRPYDLANDALLRPSLVRVEEDLFVLVVGLHHLVADGWSMMTVLLQEVAALYAAYVAGAPSPLPALSCQYADFARWERELLSGTHYDEQLAYWRGRLDNPPAPMELPTRAGALPRVGTRRAIALPAELASELRTLAEREGVTLFMVFAAVLDVLLSRYGAGDDVMIGAPITRRTRAELETLIGPILNTLVLRTDLTGDPSFRDLLGRVRAGLLEAYANQDVPFEHVLRALQAAGVSGRAPLFKVALTMQNHALAEVALPGLTVTQVEGDSGAGQDELRLEVWDGAEGLRCWWVDNGARHDEGLLAELSDHLRTLLVAIVRDPSQRVGSLKLLSASEELRQVQSWNETGTQFSENETIDLLFEEQVAGTPEASALSFAGESWSYAQLSARSNQVAHALRRLGVGPEVRVGVCMERTPWWACSVLGVLKAGGVYVPLDGALPAERLAWMMGTRC